MNAKWWQFKVSLPNELWCTWYFPLLIVRERNSWKRHFCLVPPTVTWPPSTVSKAVQYLMRDGQTDKDYRELQLLLMSTNWLVILPPKPKEWVQNIQVPGLQQSDQRLQSLVEGGHVFIREFCQTHIFIQKQTAEQEQRNFYWRISQKQGLILNASAKWQNWKGDAVSDITGKRRVRVTEPQFDPGRWSEEETVGWTSARRAHTPQLKQKTKRWTLISSSKTPESASFTWAAGEDGTDQVRQQVVQQRTDFMCQRHHLQRGNECWHDAQMGGSSVDEETSSTHENTPEGDVSAVLT